MPHGMDDLCIVSARGTGKSWGIALLVARDAAHWKTKFSCLINRTTFQGHTELQGLLWRYLTVAFPGTTYSSGDMTCRLGGKTCPPERWSWLTPVLGQQSR